MVFESPKYEEIILPYEFVFVFITYFIEAILSKKFVRSRGFEKKKWGWPYRGLSIEGRFNLLHIISIQQYSGFHFDLCIKYMYIHEINITYMKLRKQCTLPVIITMAFWQLMCIIMYIMYIHISGTNESKECSTS